MNLLKLKEDFNNFLDEIFLYVAKGELSSNSEVFKAAAEAKIILNKKFETSKIHHISRKKIPNMLEHVLSVAHFILEENLSFSESCRKRAKQAGDITIPSVRQACRVEGLDIGIWNKMAGGDKNALKIVVEKLLKHYPYQENEIKEVFNKNN